MSEHFRKHIKKQHYPNQSSTIKFYTQFKNCILEALRQRQWKEVDFEDEWDICWSEKETIHEVFDHGKFTANQRVNHFRNHYELTRKDLMIKNLKRHKRALEKEGKLDEAASYNFFPMTFNLPSEYSIFCDEHKKANHAIWIMKPVSKSQGKGIFLFKKLSQISEWKNDSQVENYIVQRYINNPLLIGGKKFDLRIYCLVTSYSPLVAYLYRDGFARFTHHRYDNTDISNTFVHLTNVAIQKHSENYDKKIGGKWDLRRLKLYLSSKYSPQDVDKCFWNIQQLIIRTLLSMQKVIIQDKRCFELYGFDILIDSHLKPWILEVNGSPSMTANTAQDFELKCGLLDDVFTIIDMEKILTGQEEQIGGFDLIYRGSPVQSGSDINSSMLGCYNNRFQQLKHLAKTVSSRLASFSKGKELCHSDQKASRGKDTLQSVPSAVSADTSINLRKIRSKSTGKQYPTPASNITLMSSKLVKATYGQKTILAPLSQEGRERKESHDSERRISHDQQHLRLYKGKVLDLPPVGANNNTIQTTSNIVTSFPNTIQINIPQRNPGNEDITNNGSNLMNSAISTSYSHSNSLEVSLRLNKRKVNYQTSLSASLSSSYPIKGLSYADPKVPQDKGDPSHLQLSEIFGSKVKNDNDYVVSNWKIKDAHGYSIERSSSRKNSTRRDSSNPRYLKEVTEIEDHIKVKILKENKRYQDESNQSLHLSNSNPGVI